MLCVCLCCVLGLGSELGDRRVGYIPEGGRRKQVAADAGFAGHRGLSVSLLVYAVSRAVSLDTRGSHSPLSLLVYTLSTVLEIRTRLLSLFPRTGHTPFGFDSFSPLINHQRGLCCKNLQLSFPQLLRVNGSFCLTFGAHFNIQICFRCSISIEAIRIDGAEISTLEFELSSNFGLLIKSEKGTLPL